MGLWIDAMKEAGCAALFFIAFAVVVVAGSYILEKIGGKKK